jgi:hypothetical protein
MSKSIAQPGPARTPVARSSRNARRRRSGVGLAVDGSTIPQAFELATEDAVQAYRLGRLHGEVIAAAQAEVAAWDRLFHAIESLRHSTDDAGLDQRLLTLGDRAWCRRREAQTILDEVLLKGRAT